jgi:flagellar biosynthesis protein FliR
MTELFAELTALNAVALEQGLVGFAVFLRVGAIMLLLPAFAEQVIPVRVKLALALVFTMAVAPVIGSELPPTNPFPVWLFGTEVVIGLILGFGLRLFVFVLQIAGAIIAQATTLSQMFGGIGPEPQPIVSNVLILAALTLAVSAGLHVRVVEVLILSYQALPAGQLPNVADLAQFEVTQIARAFALAFSLSAPFVLASVIYNIALGFINRAMPQLAVSFIGAPALTLGGLVLLALATPSLIAVWLSLFNRHLSDPLVIIP